MSKKYKFEAIIQKVPDIDGTYVEFPYSVKTEFRKGKGNFGEPPKTVDVYIAAQPESVQPFLNQVRDTIRAVLPEAQERISWSMPTYWNKHNIIHFAAFKNHIGLYPGPKAIENFADRLIDYKTSKGAVQLPYSKRL